MKNMGNMMGMMKKAQKMQSDMKKMQKELKKLTFTGEASSGAVKAEINGEGYLKALDINEDLVVAEDKEDLEDLVIVAVNNAKDALNNHVETKTNEIMGGLQLPAGMNLPF